MRREIATCAEAAGAAKAQLSLTSTGCLGVRAGAFIAPGGSLYTLVVSDPTLGFAAARMLGGRISWRDLMRNWAIAWGERDRCRAVAALVAATERLSRCIRHPRHGDPDVDGYTRNIVPVLLGNVAGGSGLVALFYFFVYRFRMEARNV